MHIDNNKLRFGMMVAETIGREMYVSDIALVNNPNPNIGKE